MTDLVVSSHGRFRGQKQRWFLLRLTGREDLIDINAGHAEFSHWAWMEPELLIEKIVPFKRDIYRSVFETFGDLRLS